jgi:cystathionine beta-lyase/cystathionine gamma-synthase
MGITVHHVETDLAGMEEKLSSKTKVLYVETPTNPMLRLVDLHKAVSFAQRHKLVSIIDNTFATPILQNPISMGYDMVVHSATKALAGHSDIIAGAVAGSAQWMHRIFVDSRNENPGFARATTVRKRPRCGEIPRGTSKG